MEMVDPIAATLEVQDLGPKGFEVLVSLVNQGEDWLLVKSAVVDITKDDEPFGRHRLSFVGADHAGMVKVGEFGIATGRFHVNQDVDHRLFVFRVEVAYRYGDREGRLGLDRQVETQRIAKKRSWF